MNQTSPLPQNVVEAIISIATAAVIAAEGGWGAQELEFNLQSIAELATGICSEYGLEYESGEYDEHDDPVMTTKPYLSPE